MSIAHLLRSVATRLTSLTVCATQIESCVRVCNTAEAARARGARYRLDVHVGAPDTTRTALVTQERWRLNSGRLRRTSEARCWRCAPPVSSSAPQRCRPSSAWRRRSLRARTIAIGVAAAKSRRRVNLPSQTHPTAACLRKGGRRQLGSSSV
eukprot:scaffold195_cov359-Prasinococcus_capsulatus_cf.AAC.4